MEAKEQRKSITVIPRGGAVTRVAKDPEASSISDIVFNRAFTSNKENIIKKVVDFFTK